MKMPYVRTITTLVSCLILLSGVSGDSSAAIYSIPVQSSGKADAPQHQALVTTPANTAVVAGETVILQCRVDGAPPCTRVMWGEFITNSGGNIISDNEYLLNHTNKDRYRILHYSLTQFDLEIRNVTLADAGMYVCQDTLSGPPNVFRAYAELVVLATTPNCTTDAPKYGVAIEGQSYNIECSINYQGAYPPSFHWSGPPPFNLKYSSYNSTSVWSGIEYKVNRTMDEQRFEVLTNFSDIAPMPADHAKNIPSWSQLNQFDRILVYWEPKDMSVSPFKAEYAVGEPITCYADSYPSAFYQWQNLRTQQVVNDQVFTMTEDMVGHNDTLMCTAQNMIQGVIYSASFFLTPYVKDLGPANAPCDNLTGQWTADSEDMQLCLEVDSIGNLMTLLRNGTDPYFVAGIGVAESFKFDVLGFSSIWPYRGNSVTVGGYTGECHKCYGEELILLSEMSQSKMEAPSCGQSGGTHLGPKKKLSRSGPPCRGLELDVYNPQSWVYNKMGIKARPYVV